MAPATTLRANIVVPRGSFPKGNEKKNPLPKEAQTNLRVNNRKGGKLAPYFLYSAKGFIFFAGDAAVGGRLAENNMQMSSYISALEPRRRWKANFSFLDLLVSMPHRPCKERAPLDTEQIATMPLPSYCSPPAAFNLGSRRRPTSVSSA